MFQQVNWECTADTVIVPHKMYFDCQEVSPEMGSNICQQMERDGEVLQLSITGRGRYDMPYRDDPGWYDPGPYGYMPPDMGPDRPTKMQPTRFFVMKAPEDSLEMSLNVELWATQRYALTINV